MALCFFAVIILSFFTGIAIGYIIFEFYIMNRSDINFDYIEGDEVNNFLEEIRRSKDNGARMLNYRTNTRNNTDTAFIRSETVNVPHNNTQTSLSSKFRKKMNAELEGYEEVVSLDKADDIVESEEQNENIEEIAFTMPQGTPDIPDEDMIEETDEEFTSEEDDFVADDDFLKKYYYSDDETASDEDTEMVEESSDEENGRTLLIDESNTDDTIEKSNEHTYTSLQTVYLDDEPKDDDTHFFITKVKPINSSDILLQDNEEPDLSKISEISSTHDKVVSQTTIELPSVEKKDKIESNVCIPLGGSTSSETSTNNTFVAIPLTMTEKPIEPDAPPKRKRGRPRKKK